MAKKKKEYIEKATFEFRTISTDKLIGFQSISFVSKKPFKDNEMAYNLIKHEEKLYDEEITCIVTNDDRSDELMKELNGNDSKKLKAKIEELKEDVGRLETLVQILKNPI